MASPDRDIIEKLLQSSGLSCDDLIVKLQQYKAAQAPKVETEECAKTLSASLSEENISFKTNLKTSSDGEDVILETKRSNVDCDDDTTSTIEIVTVVLNEIVEKTVEECINRKSSGSNKALRETDDKVSVCSSTNEDNSVTEAIEEFLTEKSQEDDQKTKEQSTFDDEDVSQSKKPCSNIDEHNYSSIIRSNILDIEQDFSASSTEDLYKSEDDLRNTIRMQLSSLRNMKKSNTYLPDLQKKRSIFFHNLKKKRKSCDMNPVTSSKSPLVTSEDEEKGDTNNVSLIALSDETNFRIMDVTGGIDRITPTIEEEPSDSTANEERKFAAITENNNKTEATIENNTLKSSSTSEETTKVIESPRKEIKNILTTYRRKMSLNYFDKNRYKLSSTLTENKPNCITIKKNIAETFAQDPGVNKSVKKSENSPFVSDSLDDFLNESAQLKVSYPIPKLGAEEGIKEGPKESPFDGVVTATNSDIIAGRYTSQKGRPKKIKAKTLAEMRRQFEKLKSKNKAELKSKSQDEDTSSKEDLKEALHIKPSTLVNSHNISAIPMHRNSFVFCDNKKIWLSSTSRNKCIANIDRQSPSKTTNGSPVKPSSPNESSKKLSLLSCLKENKPCKIRYGAGPLCKKDKLQNLESKNHWTTELKILPKIYLEVVPEVNRPVDLRLVHLLPIFNDPLISEERADFALSVLKPRNQTAETVRCFKFQVPYKNNQEKMVVRKQYKPVVKPNTVINTPKTINTEDIEADVSKILHDIISYVEVKEIAKGLIKDDDVIAQEDDSDLISRPKGRKRKKRLELELLRLNCKVIDVASTMEESKPCSKPFCRMGCICKSLLCDSVFSDHCQLVECMFECKCPPSTVNNMIASTNSLSAQTVTHLDDKVKKNLAKVEREFTQTLIHTDNDVIFVGTGGRKRNRTARVPKKYSDFVENIDEFCDDSHKSGKMVLKQCTVNIPKLNLDSVIPYCLSHNLYHCYCKGEDISRVNQILKPKPANKDKIKFGDNYPSTKAREIKLKFGDNSSFVKVKEGRQVKHKSGDNNFSATVKEDKPISDNISISPKEDKQQQTMRQNQVRIYDYTCARARPIFSEYINRNSDPKYNEKLHTIYSRETARYNMKFERNLKKFNQVEASSTSKSAEPVLSRKGHKRKQEFTVREDQKEFALQRRRRKIKNYENSASILYHPILDGEIKVSLRDNQEMLKIIGEENKSLEYLRMLPWPKVIESFERKKLNIWSKEKLSSALLCNAAGYFPPKYFYDIRQIRHSHRSEIINWILTDELPPDIPRELMHLILTPRKNHFMISGYCLKKTHRSLKSVEDSLSTEYDQNPQQMEFGGLSSVKLEPQDDESEHESLVESQLPVLEVQEEPSFSEENDQPPVLENMLEQPSPETKLQSTHSTGPKILHVPRLIKTEVLEPEPSFKKIDLETDNLNNNFRIRPISLSKLLEPKRDSNVMIPDIDTLLSKSTIEDIEDIPSFTIPKISAVTSISEEPSPAPKSKITIRKAIPDLKLLKPKSPIKPIANLDSSISKSTVIDKEESPTFTIPKISEVTSLAEVSPQAPKPTSKTIKIVRPVRSLKSLICTSSLKSIIGQDASITKPTVGGKGDCASSATAKTADVGTDSEMAPKPNIKIRFRRSGPGGLKSVISTNRVNTGSNEELIKSLKILKPVTNLKRKQLILTKNCLNNSLIKSVTLSPKSNLMEARSVASKTSERAASTAGEILNSPKHVRVISDEVASDGNVPQAKSLVDDDPVQTILSRMRPLKPMPTEAKNVCALNEEKSTTASNITPGADLNEETRNQRLLSISNSVESIASTGELPLVFCLKAVDCESTECDTKGKQNVILEEIKANESSVCVPLGASSPKAPEVADLQSSATKSNDEEALSLLGSKTNSSEQISKTVENSQFNTNSRDSFRSDGSFKYASPTASDFGSDADFSFDIDEEILNRLEEPSDSSNTVEEAREQVHQLSFPSLLRTESSESSNSKKKKLDIDEVANDKETNREEQPVLSSRLLSTPTELEPPSNKSTKSIEEPSESQAVEEAPLSLDAEASKSISSSDKTQPSTLKLKPQASANETENCPILFKETNREGQPVLTVVLNNRPIDPKPPNQEETKLVSGRKMKCTHRDMDNNSKTMILFTKSYFKRNLCFFDETANMNKLVARLPKVNRTCKWRMIFLNSDFTFFKFTKANYSIKYTDLRDVVRMANNTKLTMWLRNKEFTDCYAHPNFGIYCIYDYTDRFFVGPFLPHEDHEISTFRYLRGKLIDTEVFNSMIGKKVEEKLPIWLYETPSKAPRKPNLPPKDVIIDISDDDDDDVCVVNNSTGISTEPVVENTSASSSSNLPRIDDNEPGIEEADESEDTSIHFPDTFLCSPFITELTKQEIADKEVNRYMLTNVPHLGYFEAYQHSNKTIDVFWPDGGRGYRFSNIKLAKFSLMFYLTQLFSTIPRSFRLTIVALIDLDKAMYKPISPGYLLWPKSYICCELGIFAKELIPKSVLDRLEVSDVYASIVADGNEEETEDNMIRLFGLALMSNVEIRKWSKASEILQWAKTEIYILKKLADNYESEKADLRSMLRANSLKIQELRVAVPSVSIPAVGLKASAKTAETIEIDDSDDEGHQSTSKANKSPKNSPRKIQSGSTSSPNQTEKRSLLKSNFKVKSNLLKITDAEREKFKLSANTSVAGCKKLLPQKSLLSRTNES